MLSTQGCAITARALRLRSIGTTSPRRGLRQSPGSGQEQTGSNASVHYSAQEALDLDKVHMYDIYAPIVPDIDWPVTYEEAKKTVCEGLAPLGDEYVAVLKKGLESGWVDVVESRGKTSGAYSWGEYGSHPFVLLNWQDNLDNMFTLAHEMGHAMHSHYSWTTQPYVYSDYSIFLAEIASTANEVLLMEHLLSLTEDQVRRMYLLNHLLEQFRGAHFTGRRCLLSSRR